MTNKTTHFDDTVYEPLARAFMEEAIAKKLRILANEKAITLSEDGLDKDGLNLTYGLLFDALLTLEAQDGLELSRERYLPALLFARIPAGQPITAGVEAADAIFLTKNRSLLHGGVDDPVIQEQARRLFAEEKSK